MLRRQASFNPTLTVYAQGVGAELSSATAEAFAPTVRVPSTVGQYKSFSAKNMFQVYDTSRALGGGAKRIDFAATDPTYNCQPQALEIAIDDAERDGAGDNQSLLEQWKTKTLLQSAILGHEDKVVTLAKTLAATGSVGAWTTSTNKPVDEIDAQIEAIVTATGIMPNRIVFGITAWRIFKSQANVINRFPNAAKIGLTTEQAAGLFLNPAMEVMVDSASKDTAKFGAAASKSSLLGSEVFIFIASSAPTPYDPSWMKTFSGGQGSVEAVRMYRDEAARSDVLAVDWSEDIQIVGSICAKRITVS